MGWISNKARNQHVRRGGAVCQGCNKPIAGNKWATHHPRCARKAAADW